MLEHADQMNVAPPEMLAHFGALAAVHTACPPTCAAPTPSPQTFRLLSAGLRHVSADCDYNSWLRICAIMFHASGGAEEGFCLLNAWSATGKTYAGERDVRKKWDSFSLDHPRPLTLASFRVLLTEQGHDWYELCAEAEGEAFEVVEMEVQQ